MKKLKYSPDAREKLKQIKQYVRQKFGTDKANKVIREMMMGLRLLWKKRRIIGKSSGIIGVKRYFDPNIM